MHSQKARLPDKIEIQQSKNTSYEQRSKRTSIIEENKEYPLPIYDKQDDIYAKAKEEALDENKDLNAAEDEGFIETETDE